MAEIDDMFSAGMIQAGDIGAATKFTFGAVTLYGMPAYDELGQREYETRTSDNDGLVIEFIEADFVASLPVAGNTILNVSTGLTHRITRVYPQPAGNPHLRIELAKGFTAS